jgi:hypothetical protein
MLLRFSLPALVICAPGWLGLYPIALYGLPYIAACVVAGGVYPLLNHRIGAHRHQWLMVRGIESVNGAGALGCLVLL